MSDLIGGSARNNRSTDAGARTISGQAPVLQAPYGMRTPRDIMNQRQAREAARKRADAEGQAYTSEQVAFQDEETRRSVDKRAAATGFSAQPRESGYRSAGASSGGRSFADPPYSPSQDQVRPTSQQQIPLSGSGPQQPQTHGRPGSGFIPGSQTVRATSIPSVVAPPAIEGAQSRSNVSSFPHAFERWETLSSHWEGLTSYWIRRLEQNTEDIRRDITTQQMARQITDLAAAGANLFHAVVELQRLRASSERKFQRWFFETRGQQERDQDEITTLRDELEEARQGVAKASQPDLDRRVAELTAAHVELDKRFGELKRELIISKDEARRAWEELGRREQEERDRQLALREGHPIYIGGVQVLPTQSALSRDPSTREAVYQTQPPGAGQTEQGYGGDEAQQPSPTDTDPFTTQPSVRPHTIESFQRMPPAVSPPLLDSDHPTQALVHTTTQNIGTVSEQPSSTTERISEPFYRQPGTFLHEPSTATAQVTHPGVYTGIGSEDGSEDEIYGLDHQGNIRYDPRGNPIRLQNPTEATMPPHVRSTASSSDDEYDVGEEAFKERAQAMREGREPPTSGRGAASEPQQRISEPSNFEGQGFGNGETGWEGTGDIGRSTRLSDVLEEEDEGRSPMSARRVGGPF